MKKIKPLLFKLRQDLAELFFYPVPSWGEDGSLDYNLYWQKRRKSESNFELSAWQKQRADLVLPFLKDDDIVVDVGGGGGEMLAYWKQFKKVKGVCADYNEWALEQAKKKGLETLFLDLADEKSWDQIPFCDYLTGFEILEHLSNPEKFIFFVKKRVRKGMIFSVPNSGYYKHRLRLLFGRFPLQWIAHPGEHLRFWTVRDMLKWIDYLGLKSKKIIIYEGLPGLNRLWPSLFGQGLLIYLQNEQ